MKGSGPEVTCRKQLRKWTVIAWSAVIRNFMERRLMHLVFHDHFLYIPEIVGEKKAVIFTVLSTLDLLMAENDVDDLPLFPHEVIQLLEMSCRIDDADGVDADVHECCVTFHP